MKPTTAHLARRLALMRLYGLLLDPGDLFGRTADGVSSGRGHASPPPRGVHVSTAKAERDREAIAAETARVEREEAAQALRTKGVG